MTQTQRSPAAERRRAPWKGVHASELPKDSRPQPFEQARWGLRTVHNDDGHFVGLEVVHV